MTLIKSVLIFGFLVTCAQSLPQNLYYGNGMAIRTRGQHGMVFTGYYSPNQNENPENPLLPEESQINEQQSGNEEEESILDPSKISNDENSENPEKPDENPEVPEGTNQMENSDEEEEEDSDEDDEDYDYWPFKFGKNSRGNTNFFPISFLGGLGRSGQNSGNVAIANSFSTGKKGIATSNARAGNAEIPKEKKQKENYSTTDFRPKRQNLDDNTEGSGEPISTENSPIPTESSLENEKIPEVIPTTEKVILTKKSSKKPKSNNFSPFGNGVNFFPIIFGSNSGRSGSLIFPGNIAIANSYSTGKNGMALSNARSFGAGGLLPSEDGSIPQEPEIPVVIPEENDPVIDTRKVKEESSEKAARLQEEPKEKMTDPENSNEEKEEDSDSNEESSQDGVYIFQKRGQENFVNFFPITFGVLGRYSSVSPNTAIANSFNTGKKGVAKSNAEASNGIPVPNEEVPEIPQDNLEIGKGKERTGKEFNFGENVPTETTTNEGPLETTRNPLETSTLLESTTLLETTSQSVTTVEPLETTTLLETTIAPLETTTLPEVSSTTTKVPQVSRRTGSRSLSPRRRGTKTFSTQNFFPITFGGSGSDSGRNVGGFSGGNIAIANSFSTGRNGIASSSASSFGTSDLRQFNSRGSNSN